MTYPRILNQDGKQVSQPRKLVGSSEEHTVRLSTLHLGINGRDDNLDNNAVPAACQDHSGRDHLHMDPLHRPRDQVELLWGLVASERAEHELEEGVFLSPVDGHDVWFECLQLHATHTAGITTTNSA